MACGVAQAVERVEGVEKERVGGVQQQLEKKDSTFKFQEKELPVIEKEQSKQTTENVRSGNTIFVKKFRLEGNTLFSEKELMSEVSLADGKNLTLDEIIGVADMITAKYRNKGFLIAFAYVPSQSIVDGAVLSKNIQGFRTVNVFGTVLIKIVEGKVGTVNVTGNRFYNSSFIERHLDRVRNDKSLKEESLEKELLILNDYPFLSVKATLKAGKDPGTTDIITSVSDSYPLSGTVSYDNYGAKTTSKNRLSASLNIGNSITNGDLIKLNGTIGIDELALDRLSYIRAEYVVPVGVLGTQVGAYYSNTMYAADGVDSLALLGLNGISHVAGAYVSHPFVKRLGQSLNMRFGGEYISLSDKAPEIMLDNDEIRKLTAGITFESTDRFLGRNYIGFSYSRALGSFLGGTENGATNPGTSYSGADNSFNKFTLDAMRLQKLPAYSHLIARGSIQYSPERLFSVERMQLGGVGSVRGVNPGKASGDSGYFFSAELAGSPFYPETPIFNQKMSDTLKFALFSDYGGVINTSPRPDEMTSATLANIGIGLRIYVGTNTSFKLDWAVPSSRGGYAHLRLTDSQVFVQALVSF
jgi:hemolysin activation/secretion protein